MYCGLLMFLITSIMAGHRIREGKALDAEGKPVTLSENPIYFWVCTIFNFIFFYFLSISLIVLPLLR
jgi:hypothetical protein